jgi:diguanylate cyclase
VRIVLFGYSKDSLLAGMNMLLISIIVPIMFNHVKSFVWRATYSNVYALVQICALVYWICPETHILWTMFLYYWAASLITGYASTMLVIRLAIYYDRQKKLEQLSTTDFLTGLNNTRKFDSVFNELTKKATELNEPISLLVVDIDHFKKINDTYGHPAGDAVLQQIAELLTRLKRQIDTVSRNGGEEFTMILLNCPKAEAIKVAKRVTQAVELFVFRLPSGKKIKITVSVGVATYLESTRDMTKLIQLADEGLYRAKRRGRNQVCFANESDL